MRYLCLIENNIAIKDDRINKILNTDVLISDDIVNKYFELNSLGKQFKIKDINGITFDEIFEEYILEINQSDLIKSELASLELVLHRDTEDTWVAIGLDTTKLPQIVQDRLARKQELRTQLQSLSTT